MGSSNMDYIIVTTYLDTMQLVVPEHPAANRAAAGKFFLSRSASQENRTGKSSRCSLILYVPYIRTVSPNYRLSSIPDLDTGTVVTLFLVAHRYRSLLL